MHSNMSGPAALADELDVLLVGVRDEATVAIRVCMILNRQDRVVSLSFLAVVLHLAFMVGVVVMFVMHIPRRRQ